MVTVASLDTSFLVPCKHCADLMQEGERFCPTCGKDQTAAVRVDAGQPAFGDPFGTTPDTGFDTGLGLVRPDTLWRAEALRVAAPALSVERSDPSKRWLLGIAAALTALLMFALVHDAFFAEPQRVAGQPPAVPIRDVKGKLDQVQDALRGGDLRADERARAVVDAESAVPAAPVASFAPAPTTGTRAADVGETIEKGCNEAMAALALCQKK